MGACQRRWVALRKLIVQLLSLALWQQATGDNQRLRKRHRQAAHTLYRG